MASEKILNQKKEEVSKLAEKIKSAKLVLLTDYRGITVTDVTDLRSELRKSGTEYTVIKNNITRRALEEAGIEGLEETLVGPTAVIMNEEEYNQFNNRDFFFTKRNVEVDLSVAAAIIETYVEEKYEFSPLTIGTRFDNQAKNILQ